jgi:hypothetical protein
VYDAPGCGPSGSLRPLSRSRRSAAAPVGHVEGAAGSGKRLNRARGHRYASVTFRVIQFGSRRLWQSGVRSGLSRRRRNPPWTRAESDSSRDAPLRARGSATAAHQQTSARARGRGDARVRRAAREQRAAQGTRGTTVSTAAPAATHGWSKAWLPGARRRRAVESARERKPKASRAAAGSGAARVPYCSPATRSRRSAPASRGNALQPRLRERLVPPCRR